MIRSRLTRRRALTAIACTALAFGGKVAFPCPLPSPQGEQQHEGIASCGVVIIVHDERVSGFDLVQRCRSLREGGREVYTLQTRGPLTATRFLTIQKECEEVLSNRRCATHICKTAVMAWCDVGNPLRELPFSTSADLAIATLALRQGAYAEADQHIPQFVLEGRDELVEFLMFPTQFTVDNGIPLAEGRHQRQQEHLVYVVEDTAL